MFVFLVLNKKKQFRYLVLIPLIIVVLINLAVSMYGEQYDRFAHKHYERFTYKGIKQNFQDRIGLLIFWF